MSAHGRLWDAVDAALQVRNAMRADGASQLEADTALEEALRQHWLSVREWKYLCTRCDDTGLQLERRPAVIYGGAFVDVGVPCTCARGERFRPRRRHDDDYIQAAKVTKPQRFGQR